MFVARAIDGMAGGVERMVIAIMNALVARGHEVALLSWDVKGSRSFYPMADGITWHTLDLGDPAIKASPILKARRAKMVRSLVRRARPETIVCFQDGPYFAIRAYTVGMNIPVIVAERNAPSRFQHTSAGRRQGMTYQAFRFARRILIQFESYRNQYPKFLRSRIVTIPNPIFPAPRQATPDRVGESGRLRLLCVGRLGYQKNQLALVEAFSHLAEEFSKWDLVLIGEGEGRADLEFRVSELGLEERISMPGTSACLSDWYCTSHLFCLPSRWEGFPNALAEALAHGLPAVGFEGCAGVESLIAPGRNGILARGNGDVSSLACALKTLMANAEQRRTLGAAAAGVSADYSPEEVFARWERALMDVVRT